MNQTLCVLAFMFVLWMILSPHDPQVSPGLEQAAIRLVNQEMVR